MNSNLAIVSATGNADVLFGIENVTGTALADEIVGNLAESNTLIGGAGNDTINGLSGNNNLQGGADNDTIISGSGDNVIDGGAGSDTVDYSYLTGTSFGDDDATNGQVNGIYYSGVKVDLTDSGFPNYLEFRYLYNDLELRKQYLDKLVDTNALKEQFLDTLLRKKESIRKTELFKASSIIYYTSVEKKYIFNRFVQGKILDAPKDANYDYVTSWSFYDVSHNRPFICFMYFNYDGKNAIKDKEKIYQTLKESADREMSLDTMAYNIDRKLIGQMKRTSQSCGSATDD